MKKTYGENILEEKIEIDKLESNGVKIEGLKYTRKIIREPWVINKRDKKRDRKVDNRKWLAILKKVWPIATAISLELIPEIIKWVSTYPEIIVIIQFIRP